MPPGVPPAGRAPIVVSEPSEPMANTVTFIGPSLPAKRNLPSGVAASEMSPSTFPAFIRNGDPMRERLPVLGSMAKAAIVRLAVLVT
jgi:hypothetical protein